MRYRTEQKTNSQIYGTKNQLLHTNFPHSTFVAGGTMNEAQYTQLPLTSNQDEFYHHVIQNAHALINGETDLIANCANIAALLFNTLSNVNWCGFYFLKEELVLGPFQGKPACVRIAVGKGVCGTAALEQRTIIVDDVEQFPGHIACDAESRSEIVVPMMFDDGVLGILDIDSPVFGRFNETDARYLEKIVHSIVFASSSTFNSETM